MCACIAQSDVRRSTGKGRGRKAWEGRENVSACDWSALDFAWHFVSGLPNIGTPDEYMRRISSGVYFIAGEQTPVYFDVTSSADEDGDAATSSLLAVVQQRQEPQRIDLIWTARHTPRAVAFLSARSPDTINWSKDSREEHRFCGKDSHSRDTNKEARRPINWSEMPAQTSATREGPRCLCVGAGAGA